MITVRQYDNLKIPDYALSYLINGDSSGLEENDIHAIDLYMRDFYNMVGAGESLIFSTMEDDFHPEFCWRPAFGLACDVVDCTILIVR